jgi:membrane protein DedA with SNARE-associated domain
MLQRVFMYTSGLPPIFLMFDTITNTLVAWAQTVPLEVFTFVGSFVEEVLAPIPSPIIMTATGSIAAAQEKAMWYLLVLSLIGAFGKTIGAVLVYFIADKAEDILIGRFGKIIGVSHAEVEALGKKFKGTWKDVFLLLFLRALPIMSSAVVSVCSGVIKIRMRTYLIATFLGTIIRDFFYLYVGFTGIETLHRLVDGFDSIESIIQAVIAILIVVFIGWIAWKRKMREKTQKAV